MNIFTRQDHSTINRWVIQYSPQLEEAFQRRKRPVWVSWRMDETYVKVQGQWRSLDGREANEAAIKSYNEAHGTNIIIRQVQYLDTIVEQDHRGVKRVTRPMLGFQSFEAAQDTLVGIALMHMIKKKQMVLEAEDEGLTAAELFYSLAA